MTSLGGDEGSRSRPLSRCGTPHRRFDLVQERAVVAASLWALASGPTRNFAPPYATNPVSTRSYAGLGACEPLHPDLLSLETLPVRIFGFRQSFALARNGSFRNAPASHVAAQAGEVLRMILGTEADVVNIHIHFLDGPHESFQLNERSGLAE